MSHKSNDNIFTSEDAFSDSLALRLRRERLSRNWSIADLALESGVSKAMISKIERAETSPTAALLGRLSGAFGITISDMLASAEGSDASNRVLRHEDQETWQDPDTSYIRRSITPVGADPELITVALPPEASVTYPPSSYSFVKGHCIWMTSGRLNIAEGTENTQLRKGDCYIFDLTQACARTYTNPSQSQVARYIVSLTRR